MKWFGHMECKDHTDWTGMLEVEGNKPKGRLRKTWWRGIKEDMKRFGLSQDDAPSRGEGKLRWYPVNLGLAGRCSLNR